MWPDKDDLHSRNNSWQSRFLSTVLPSQSLLFEAQQGNLATQWCDWQTVCRRSSQWWQLCTGLSLHAHRRRQYGWVRGLPSGLTAERGEATPAGTPGWQSLSVLIKRAIHYVTYLPLQHCCRIKWMNSYKVLRTWQVNTQKALNVCYC